VTEEHGPTAFAGNTRSNRMTDRTYRVTELVGTSKDGVEAAIRAAISRAGVTLRHVDWFEVTEIRGYIRDNVVDSYQVGLKLGFRLEDP
jgi:flavin-binding protein dodecin